MSVRVPNVNTGIAVTLALTLLGSLRFRDDPNEPMKRLIGDQKELVYLHSMAPLKDEQALWWTAATSSPSFCRLLPEWMTPGLTQAEPVRWVILLLPSSEAAWGKAEDTPRPLYQSSSF